MDEAVREEELDVCNMTGTYTHNVDEKGRINFPAKLREQLGATFWISRGTSDQFLSVYSAAGWKEVMRQIKDLPGPQGEKMRRWICSGAAEVTPDKQGRILIPTALREYAGLKKDVVVAGTGRKAEIWDAERWNEQISFEPLASGLLNNVVL